MENRIIRISGVSNARVVVELGPGTGGTTQALLRKMPADSVLICIELDSYFAKHVSLINDDRLLVHNGSASSIQDVLVKYGYQFADVVISGIPFSTMRGDVAMQIVESTYQSLKPGGVFIAYQLRSHVAKWANKVFGKENSLEFELVNIPPMRVYRWLKN